MMRAALFLLALAARPAAADAVPLPPAITVPAQAPGYYRFVFGDYAVTALLDGTHGFAAQELAVGAAPGEVKTLLARQYQSSPVEGMINAFLIDTGSRRILIDTGAGDLYGKDGGLLVRNLVAAGYAPDQIDEIYLTHLHRDHVGGLMLHGAPVFPRAIVRVSRIEAAFWLNDANRAKAPAFLGTMFDGAQAVLKPYIASGRFKPFGPNEPLSAGIRAVPAPGHTPGHTYYVIASGGQTLVFWGDIVHVAPVQFARPAIAIKYDLGSADAIRSRETIFAQAAHHGWWVAAAHIAFPGIGHVLDLGGGHYAWAPANYSLNR